MNFKFICLFSKYFWNISMSCKPWFLPSNCSYSSWGGKPTYKGYWQYKIMPCFPPCLVWPGWLLSSLQQYGNFLLLTATIAYSSLLQYKTVVKCFSRVGCISGFISELRHSLAVWPWPSYSACLILLCKMKTIIVPTSQCYSENQMN